MKALVVYDSFFGNTEQIAKAIDAALRERGEATVLRVGDVKPEHLVGLNLLVVGSPTRAFSASPDMKTFLKRLDPKRLKGIQVAGFDTRIAAEDTGSRVLPVLVKVFGYTAEPIAATLVKKGGVQAAPPAGFIVLGTEGPLKDGELARAAQWAQQMIA